MVGIIIHHIPLDNSGAFVIRKLEETLDVKEGL